jgi:hypothetical protein
MRRRALLIALAGSLGIAALTLPAASPVQAAAQLPRLQLSPGGSDKSRCTAAAPCLTLQRAYDLARPGQVVELAGGTYPAGQEVHGTKPGGVRVVFVAASRARPYLPGGITISADRLELRRLRVDYFDAIAGSDGLTARNVDSNWFEVHGARNVRVLGGDVGPSYRPGDSSPNVLITYGDDAQGESNVMPQNVVIDGATFHDFRRGTDADHMECMFVVGVDGLTVRNSRFIRCDIYSIFFTQAWWDAPGLVKPSRNILLENNVFDSSTDHGEYGETYDSVRFSDWMDHFENITVRYNSFKQDFSFGDNPKRSVEVYGNIGPRGWCSNGDVDYHHNVWQWNTGERCGARDRMVRGKQWGFEMLGFEDPGSIDLRLKPSSPGVNAGFTGAYPRRDIAGKQRPAGGAPDAGAYEVR